VDLSFDPALAAGYVSRSQIARVLPEAWIVRELACLACGGSPLAPTIANTRARDFVCESCSEGYELKSSSRRFGLRVIDGAFDTMRETVRGGRAPNLLLLEYDLPTLAVTNLDAIPRAFLTPSAIVSRRAPLASTARRAGWLGCYIDLRSIPEEARVPVVVDGIPASFAELQRRWHRFQFMIELRPRDRSWLADTMTCLDLLPPSSPFGVPEVYAFEAQLALLHPENRHIREKIRQQLQILVSKGWIRRTSRGEYVRVQP
jgi:type II restriction enzyme